MSPQALAVLLAPGSPGLCGSQPPRCPEHPHHRLEELMGPTPRPKPLTLASPQLMPREGGRPIAGS